MEKNDDKIMEYLDKMNKDNQVNIEKYLGVLNEQHTEDLRVIKEYIKISQEQFEKINIKLDSHTEILGTIMEDVTVLKEDVSVLKEDMKDVKNELKNKTNNSDFILLKQQVIELS